ncbi:Gfo/Idh/MocA family protein [Dactylosporangium sp. CA-233914]|uniref:Gfo/Idh/MocA family protein n=1 Tax=Dactylosporangium sp. CA-233914 TaxID=3239934 RepID=UPI003D91A387
MADNIRAGILGTGFMGRVHGQAILAAGARVVGVVGRTHDSGTEAALRYPHATGFATVDALLDAGVDVVHVCLPNALHHEASRTLIAAGVAVVCEKPLATSLQDAADLTDAAADAGIVTGVPFVYRYYPVVREIRRRLRRDGSRLWLLHGSYLQDWLASRHATNWRVEPSAGGRSRAFGDIGIHWCDLMEYVTGHRITRLSARLGNAFDREGGPEQNLTEDGGLITFETDAGAIGSLVISQVSAGRRNRLWFSFDGPEVSYSFNQESPESMWVGLPSEAHVVDRDPSSGGEQSRRSNALPPGHPQGYQHCFNDFVADTYAAIRGDDPGDRPQFADGLRAAQLTEAVLTSTTSRSEWIDVPAAGQD